MAEDIAGSAAHLQQRLLSIQHHVVLPNLLVAAAVGAGILIVALLFQRALQKQVTMGVIHLQLDAT